MRELDEDIFRTAEELGIDLVPARTGFGRRRRAAAQAERGF